MSEIKVGDRRTDRLGTIRVMAVAEGYAMCRRPRAIPFAMQLSELLLTTAPVPVVGNASKR